MINGDGNAFSGNSNCPITERQLYYLNLIKTELNISIGNLSTSEQAWYFIKDHYYKIKDKNTRSILAQYLENEQIEEVLFSEIYSADEDLALDYDADYDNPEVFHDIYNKNIK